MLFPRSCLFDDQDVFNLRLASVQPPGARGPTDLRDGIGLVRGDNYTRRWVQMSAPAAAARARMRAMAMNQAVISRCWTS